MTGRPTSSSLGAAPAPPLTFHVVGLREPAAGWRARCLAALEASGYARRVGARPDFVLRLGGAPGAEPAAAGEPAAWGAPECWSFEVAGLEVGRLEEACRRAVAAPAGSVTARLVARRRADGARAVLREGRLPVTGHSLRRTLRTLTGEMELWPAEACRMRAALGSPFGGQVRAGADADEGPGRGEVGAPPAPGFLAPRLLLRGASRALRVLFRPDRWNIGLVPAPAEAFLGGWPAGPIRWAETPPAGGFKADPFGLVRDGRLFVLYEELDPRLGRGRIVAEEWDREARVLERRPVLEMDIHLSYPYLLVHEDEIYCVPEMAAARRVTLFRALEFPWRWEEDATLLRDVAVLDSTLFRHGDRWWLLGTDRERGPRHALRAWCAPRLRGPWTPHAANPVKLDIHSARPAGPPFRHGDRLYRPAQDGAGRYGSAVVLNRIVELTPEVFREETVCRIEPDPPGGRAEGFHTLSGVDGWTLVDLNRTVLRPWAPARRALRLLSRGSDS